MTDDDQPQARRVDRARRHVRVLSTELATVRPAHGASWVAARASTTLLVALLVLWAFGRLDLALYASFGAFTSVYGGAVRSFGRWRLQAALGGVLTLAVVSGVLVALSDARAWLGIALAAVWGSAAAWWSDRFAWRPPGPLFVVFAVSTCAAVPTTTGRVLPAAVVAAGTALLAVLLGAVEVALRGSSTGPAVTAPPRSRWLLHALRCGVVVAVAGAIATAAGIGRPSWAMVAAVVPLAPVHVHGQVARGVHRVWGTVVGLALAALLLQVHLPVPAVVLTVAVLQGMTELVVGRLYGLALVFITPLALLMVQLAAPVPVGGLLRERLVETLIGSAVGIAAAVLTRRRRVH